MDTTTEEQAAGQLTVQDEHHIARVLAGLDDRHHALTVSVEGKATDYPAHLQALSLEGAALSLRITDAGGLAPHRLEQRGLTLKAENDQALRFEHITVKKARREEQTLIIDATLPKRMLTAARRGYARVKLRGDMPVEAELALFADQPPIASKLWDISGGGCLVRLALAESVPLTLGVVVPRLTLTFPNGERFSASASVRHVTPVAGTFDAAIGLAFESLDKDQRQRLLQIALTTEREIAWRSGEGSRLASPTALYAAQDKRRRTPKTRARRRASPKAAEPLRRVARHLHLFRMALQNGEGLPVERLERSVDTLLRLLRTERQAFFYGLACLTDEPPWLQHSLNVAGKLADLMQAEPTLATHTRAAVRAALIHDMGKALLIDDALPSLESELTDAQRQRLQTHVATLMATLSHAGYPCDAVERDLIVNINERLDGSGYPRGASGETLSSVARMAAVVDVIDAMTRPRGDRVPMSAVQAYHYLYHRPARFDQHWVTRYVQRHGFYPLGSLVEFSHGYLAWVLSLDERGQPNRVRVVRNVRHRDVFYDDEIGRVDFAQLGRLTGPAPAHLHDL